MTNLDYKTDFLHNLFLLSFRFGLQGTHIVPAKERMKKYRQNMKNNSEKHAEHLAKERERSRKRREEMKNKLELNPKLKEISREKSRNRVRLFRARIKEKQLDSETIFS